MNLKKKELLKDYFYKYAVSIITITMVLGILSSSVPMISVCLIGICLLLI
jgi:uncharacterized membrane protein